MEDKFRNVSIAREPRVSKVWSGSYQGIHLMEMKGGGIADRVASPHRLLVPGLDWGRGMFTIVYIR
jgi:hypothetical protein